VGYAYKCDECGGLFEGTPYNRAMTSDKRFPMPEVHHIRLEYYFAQAGLIEEWCRNCTEKMVADALIRAGKALQFGTAARPRSVKWQNQEQEETLSSPTLR
jgi:hypothetical protein